MSNFYDFLQFKKMNQSQKLKTKIEEANIFIQNFKTNMDKAIAITRKLKKDFSPNQKQLGGKNDKVTPAANLVDEIRKRMAELKQIPRISKNDINKQIQKIKSFLKNVNTNEQGSELQKAISNGNIIAAALTKQASQVKKFINTIEASIKQGSSIFSIEENQQKQIDAIMKSVNEDQTRAMKIILWLKGVIQKVNNMIENIKQGFKDGQELLEDCKEMIKSISEGASTSQVVKGIFSGISKVANAQIPADPTKFAQAVSIITESCSLFKKAQDKIQRGKKIIDRIKYVLEEGAKILGDIRIYIEQGKKIAESIKKSIELSASLLANGLMSRLDQGKQILTKFKNEISKAAQAQLKAGSEFTKGMDLLIKTNMDISKVSQEILKLSQNYQMGEGYLEIFEQNGLAASKVIFDLKQAIKGGSSLDEKQLKMQITVAALFLPCVQTTIQEAQKQNIALDNNIQKTDQMTIQLKEILEGFSNKERYQIENILNELDKQKIQAKDVLKELKNVILQKKKQVELRRKDIQKSKELNSAISEGNSMLINFQSSAFVKEVTEELQNELTVHVNKAKDLIKTISVKVDDSKKTIETIGQKIAEGSKHLNNLGTRITEGRTKFIDFNQLSGISQNFTKFLNTSTQKITEHKNVLEEQMKKGLREVQYFTTGILQKAKDLENSLISQFGKADGVINMISQSLGKQGLSPELLGKVNQFLDVQKAKQLKELVSDFIQYAKQLIPGDDEQDLSTVKADQVAQGAEKVASKFQQNFSKILNKKIDIDVSDNKVGKRSNKKQLIGMEQLPNEVIQKVGNQMQAEFYQKGKKQQYDHLPRIHNDVRDPCCVGLFLVNFLGFIGLSIWGIILFGQNGAFTIKESDSQSYFENVTYEKLRWFFIIILSCLGAGFLVSLILLFGFNKFPKVTVNLVCHVGNWFMVGLCIFLLVYDKNTSEETSSALQIYSGSLLSFFIFFGVIAFYYRKSINKARKVIQFINKILSKQPIVRKMSFLYFFIVMIILIIWCFAIYGFYLGNVEKKLDNQGFFAILGTMGVLLVFFLFFFYYSTIFISSFSMGLYGFSKSQFSPYDRQCARKYKEGYQAADDDVNMYESEWAKKHQKIIEQNKNKNTKQIDKKINGLQTNQNTGKQQQQQQIILQPVEIEVRAYSVPNLKPIIIQKDRVVKSYTQLSQENKTQFEFGEVDVIEFKPFRQCLHQLLMHVGTITFASVLSLTINFVKMLSYATTVKKLESKYLNFIGEVLDFLFCFLTEYVEAMIKVLNTFAIATSALTGQSFVQSARTAGYFCFLDLYKFGRLTMVSGIIRIGATFCVASIPTFIGTALLKYIVDNDKITMAGAALLFITNSIVCVAMLNVYIDSLIFQFVFLKLQELTSKKNPINPQIEQDAKNLRKAYEYKKYSDFRADEIDQQKRNLLRKVAIGSQQIKPEQKQQVQKQVTNFDPFSRKKMTNRPNILDPIPPKQNPNILYAIKTTIKTSDYFQKIKTEQQADKKEQQIEESEEQQWQQEQEQEQEQEEEYEEEEEEGEGEEYDCQQFGYVGYVKAASYQQQPEAQCGSVGSQRYKKNSIKEEEIVQDEDNPVNQQRQISKRQLSEANIELSPQQSQQHPQNIPSQVQAVSNNNGSSLQPNLPLISGIQSSLDPVLQQSHKKSEKSKSVKSHKSINQIQAGKEKKSASSQLQPIATDLNPKELLNPNDPQAARRGSRRKSGKKPKDSTKIIDVEDLQSDAQEIDENKIQDKIMIPKITQNTPSMIMKFPSRSALLHCPGCHVMYNLQVSDFGVKKNLYQVWPQRVQKQMQQRDARVSILAQKKQIQNRREQQQKFQQKLKQMIYPKKKQNKQPLPSITELYKPTIQPQPSAEDPLIRIDSQNVGQESMVGLNVKKSVQF